MKIAAVLTLVVALGFSNLAYAGTWWCAGSGSAPGTGTNLKLDKVEITYIGTNNATFTGSTVGDAPMGCSNGWTFSWTQNLAAAGTKEAHATALAAFLSNSDVCLSVVSCVSGGGPILDAITIKR